MIRPNRHVAGILLTRMASTELDAGLSERQIDALERLTALGAEPAPIGANGKPKWDSDPKIRAFQMIFDGRLGGPQEGSGRKRQPRSAEVLAEKIRDKTAKMDRALDRALSKKAGARTNLDAVKVAIEIERQERKLQIEEEEHDGNIGNVREEIIAALFELVQNPEVAAALEPASAEEIVIDGEFIEETAEKSPKEESPSVTSRTRTNGDAASITENGNNGGNVIGNGRRRTPVEGSKVKNPLRKAALRRAAER